MTVNFNLKIFVLLAQLMHTTLSRMSTSSLSLNYCFHLFVSGGFIFELRPEVSNFTFEFDSLSIESHLLILEACHCSLQFSSIAFLSISNSLHGVVFFFQPISFSSQNVLVRLRLLKLVSDLVNVPFKSHDLLDIVFFFFLKLSQLVGSSTNVSIILLHLVVKVSVFFLTFLNIFLKTVNLLTSISVII